MAQSARDKWNKCIDDIYEKTKEYDERMKKK